MNIVFPYKKKDPDSINPALPIGPQLCNGKDRILIIEDSRQPADQQKLPFSEMKLRLRHILENNRILTWHDLLGLSFKQISSLPAMGKGSLEELRILMEKSLSCGFPIRLSQTQKEQYEKMTALLSSAEKEALAGVLDSAWQKLLSESSPDQKNQLTDSLPAVSLRTLLLLPEMEKPLENLLVQSFPDPFDFNELGSRFSIPVAEVMKNQIIPELMKQERLVQTPEGFVFVESTLEKWVESLPEKQKQIMKERIFEGWSLEQSAQVYGLSRERIRQIIHKCISKAPVFWFSHLLFWFEKYDLNIESGEILFELSLPEARFLINSRPNSRNRLSVYDIINDPKMNLALYQNYMKYVHRNDLCIDGTMVERRGLSILRCLAMRHASSHAVPAAEIIDLYEKVLDQHDIPADSTLRYASLRSCEAALLRSDWIINSHRHTVRYYDLSRVDWTEITEQMSIPDFENMLISARLIFTAHPELMKQLDLHSEYELHAVLKKTEPVWNRDGKYNVIFNKSPMILFGQADYKEQLISLIEELGPISGIELSKIYSSLYGNQMATVQNTLLPLVSEYNDRGTYQSDLPVFNGEQCRIMKEVMAGKLRTVLWTQKQFSERFPGDDLRLINARSMKKIGYQLSPNFALPERYKNLEQWMEDYFKTNKTLNLNIFQEEGSDRIGIIRNILQKLRAEMKIIQTDLREYVLAESYYRTYPGLTEELLLDYLEKSSAAARKDIIFNDYLLRRSGFHHRVYELNIPSLQLDLLRKNLTGKNYLLSGNGYLFGHQPLLTSSVLRLILTENPGQTVQELRSHWLQTWNISPNELKAKLILSNSGFYEDNDRWYTSRENYFQTLSLQARSDKPEASESMSFEEESMLLNGPGKSDELPAACRISRTAS